jgi:hypothetical protein
MTTFCPNTKPMPPAFQRLIAVALWAAWLWFPCKAAERDGSVERAADEAILLAYQSASAGFSSDEIILDDELREAFLFAIDPDWSARGDDWQTQTLLRLLSLRKAGKLPAIASKRGRAVDDSLIPIAEIAARSVLDESGASSDELLCDPRLRSQLHSLALSIDPMADSYAIRKAVLRLRKTRQLRPELTLRVADWDRVIEVHSLEQLTTALENADAGNTISSGPGVYVFRDATGYLYIGEAINLRERLRQHLHESDRLSLRHYLNTVASGTVTIELHIFGPRSPANQLTVRRAYESELIRSREPRLNMRP